MQAIGECSFSFSPELVSLSRLESSFLSSSSSKSNHVRVISHAFFDLSDFFLSEAIFLLILLILSIKHHHHFSYFLPVFYDFKNFLTSFLSEIHWIPPPSSVIKCCEGIWYNTPRITCRNYMDIRDFCMNDRLCTGDAAAEKYGDLVAFWGWVCKFSRQGSRNNITPPRRCSENNHRSYEPFVKCLHTLSILKNVVLEISITRG